MVKPLVAGNWKMNGSRESVAALTEALLADVGNLADGMDIAVCPSFLHLPLVAEQLAGTPLAVGAQNVADHDDGAFTGEVSASMLREFAVRYAIVGHSERRHLYGESSGLVARRFAAAQRHGLTPILCVGETLDERQEGETESVVAAQVAAVLDEVGSDDMVRAVIAYEPVWAIGTGHTASPEQAQEVHGFLRGFLKERGVASERLPLLYGGSVKPDNAEGLFGQSDIDGGLIGGASLQAADFLAICRAALAAAA